MSFLRFFDLTYWQLRSALGYPIPSAIEARWPHQMSSVGNPHKCGMCEARQKYPGLHAAYAIQRGKELPDDQRQDLEHRVRLAVKEYGPPLHMVNADTIALILSEEGVENYGYLAVKIAEALEQTP